NWRDRSGLGQMLEVVGAEGRATKAVAARSMARVSEVRPVNQPPDVNPTATACHCATDKSPRRRLRFSTKLHPVPPSCRQKTGSSNDRNASYSKKFHRIIRSENRRLLVLKKSEAAR